MTSRNTSRSRKQKRAPRGGMPASQMLMGQQAVVHSDLKDVKELLQKQLLQPLPDTRDAIIRRPRQNRTFTAVFNSVTTLAGSTTVETDASYGTALNQFGDYSAWATAFDTYRIIGVTIKFIPITTGVIAPLYTAIDYDDSSATALTTLLAYDTLEIAPSNVYVERSYVPALAIAVYNGAAFVGYAQKKMQWTDCGNAGIPWYGLKLALTASTPAASYDVVTTATVQFKNKR